MPGEPTAEEELLAAKAHRAMAIDANNSTWELLDGRTSRNDFTADEIDEVLARAYAAAYHWARAFETGPTNSARASWLLSRTHAVLGHGELSLHHADQCGRLVMAAGLDDFDLGYSHEARARALACLGGSTKPRRSGTSPRRRRWPTPRIARSTRPISHLRPGSDWRRPGRRQTARPQRVDGGRQRVPRLHERSKRQPHHGRRHS